MKKHFIGAIVLMVVAMFGCGILSTAAYAEDESSEETEAPKTSITLSPVSRTLAISSESTYDGTLSVTNDGSSEIKVEVHVSPYSYVYSSEEDEYKLGFNNENNFTQISRWIKIKDADGNYVDNPTFKIPAGETLEIAYQITTPSNIPAGGQYAVIFVQTVSDNKSGIQAEASAGMIVYGRSNEGETQISSEINNLTLGQGTTETQTNADGTQTETKNNHFYGSAKVKNTGNVDFFARGVLKAEPIIGFSSYETPDDSGAVSVIPESERTVSDEWTETPDFGIYKVSYTVTAGENTETTEQVFFIIPPVAIIIFIIVLTIIIIAIIMTIRKRKERRSRLAI